ncbi:MAG: DUF402 domain-containing protein [Acidimicrobiales bacterium]
MRTSTGYDTQDLELDLIVRPDGPHEVKDADPNRGGQVRSTSSVPQRDEGLFRPGRR